MFDEMASSYAAVRPPYPDAVYDALETSVGRRFKWMTVLDVGAGTGIATEAMVARGAAVVAIDTGRQMLAQLRSVVPGAQPVSGDGNELPIGDETIDLVTYAQALHWTDPEQSIPEALRVLRPEGVLAAWWNVPDPSATWVARQAERMKAAAPTFHGYSGTSIATRLGEPPFGLAVEYLQFAWSRRIPLDQHITMLGTHSYIMDLAPRERRELLSTERGQLAEVFPDGVVTEFYVTELTVAAAGRGSRTATEGDGG